MLSLHRMIIGQFIPGAGFLYRLDPRTKIIMVMAVMISVLLHISGIYYAVLISLLIILLLTGGVSLRLMATNLKPAIWLIGITILFHFAFSGRSDPEIAISAGFISISKTAFNLALIYSARVMIFVLSTLCVALTTGPMSISEAVVSLIRPLRKVGLPVYDLGMIMFMALRFIPVLAGELQTIRNSQYLRGIDFSGNPMARIRSSLSIVLPLFFSTLRRADNLSIAIDTRGYIKGQPRGSLYQLRFKAADFLFLTIVVAVTVLFVYAEG